MPGPWSMGFTPGPDSSCDNVYLLGGREQPPNKTLPSTLYSPWRLMGIFSSYLLGLAKVNIRLSSWAAVPESHRVLLIFM